MTSQRIERIRRFKYRVLPGREAEYEAYLKNVVEPIDHVAFEQGAFERVFMMKPLENGEQGIQFRVFEFRDQAQFDAFPALIAQAAENHDGSAEATAKRKAYAETLRQLVDVQDFEVQG